RVRRTRSSAERPGRRRRGEPCSARRGTPWRRRITMAAATEGNARGFGYYCRLVSARAWADTVRFLKAQVLFGSLIAVLTAIVTGVVSAEVGEKFNVHIAVYAVIVAGLVVAFGAFLFNLIAAPWRLHEEQETHLREFKRRLTERDEVR